MIPVAEVVTELALLVILVVLEDVGVLLLGCMVDVLLDRVVDEVLEIVVEDGRHWLYPNIGSQNE